MKVWQVLGLLVVLTAFLFAPALASKTVLSQLLQKSSLFAFGDTFSVSPDLLTLDAYVGQAPASATFTVHPLAGDFEFYPIEYILFPKGEDYCLTWNDDGICESYDFQNWAKDGLLCNFLSFDTTEDGTWSLQIPEDEEDTISVSLSVPCHSGECGMYDTHYNLMFPEEFLDVPLSCEVVVAGVPQVTFAPLRAYAQESTVTDTVTITATVHLPNVSEEPKLTLPTETGYDGVRGVRSSGPSPEKGIADEDEFTFKVVYTNAGEVAPETICLSIFNECLPLEVDSATADATLRDGSYVNGEQYTLSRTLPKGMFPYGFEVLAGGTTVRLDQDEQAHLYTVTAGYSSVAFLPGLQASRLFEQGTWFENQLWEPNWNADAEALVMKADGSGASIYSDMYTKVGPDGVLDEVLDFGSNIYKTFLSDLEKWKTEEHLLADYAVLAYDWRLAFDDVLRGGKVDGEKVYFDPSHATDIPHIYAELARLAEGSDTGRVSVVAHSMGGLLVKKLLADLEDDTAHPYRHLLGKIDIVVLVASPQLGTPKAVASLLHGTGQEFEPLAYRETLRRIAHDMPSAYTLVPSPLYFEKVYDVGEDGTVLDHTVILSGRGDAVTDYDAMRHFMETNYGEAGDNLVVPMYTRSDFADDAKILHERIDGWMPPDVNNDGERDFKVVQIAGWGIQDTLKGIEYIKAKRKVTCPEGTTGTCYEDFLYPRPMLTADGDGTVVVPSAVTMGEESDESRRVETWYVDMYAYNNVSTLGITNKNRDHASILEVESLRNLLQTNIKKQEVNEEHVYVKKDDLTLPHAYLRLAMHSPVDVSIQNSEGFVGKKTSADGAMYTEEGVSNSYYFEFGEGKYLGVPLDGEEYTVELVGTDDGVFTFELIEERNGVAHSTKTFRDVPVTPLTQGVLHVSQLEDVTVLELDTTGDGVSDTIIYADEVEKPASFEVLKEEILKLDTKAKKQLLQTVDTAERFSEKGNIRVAKLMLTLLEKEITFLSSKKQPVKMRIEEVDAEHIILIIQELKKTF